MLAGLDAWWDAAVCSHNMSPKTSALAVAKDGLVALNMALNLPKSSLPTTRSQSFQQYSYFNNNQANNWCCFFMKLYQWKDLELVQRTVKSGCIQCGCIWSANNTSMNLLITESPKGRAVTQQYFSGIHVYWLFLTVFHRYLQVLLSSTSSRISLQKLIAAQVLFFLLF